MGKSEAGAALLIALKPAAQSVSAVSSLLREVQAALREAGRIDPNTARAFEVDQSPVLMVRITNAADGVSLGFEFADPVTRVPLADISEAVALRFIGALETELKRRPLRTLWGQPAAARRRSGEGERDPLGDRASMVLAELSRMPAAVVSGAGHLIQIKGETAEIF